ncbi:MAG: hypothetical protein ACRD22_02000 [Terriglobia bacterium]
MNGFPANSRHGRSGTAGRLLAIESTSTPSRLIRIAEIAHKGIAKRRTGQESDDRLADAGGRCDLLARGIFTSVADLSRKIRKYIRAYAKFARPFRWSQSDPTRRIIANPMTETAY